MEPTLPGALSRAAARVLGSRFAKPIARVALAAAGLALLALVGRTAIAGAGAASMATASASAASPVEPPQGGGSLPRSGGAIGPSSGTPASAPATEGPLNPSPRTRASADDPVVLNTATDSDLRRLPGIGAKRADAILALRARLGRFRALEDLLKVRGIGRATLKRLRPLVRLDLPTPDAGPPR
ncbi:MAG TPA: ComEA family DNA-binding protein, partial [Polyangiaceae bacterium]|nr:ComEA family DNA-binding protein [Polyangiaceae bacterium]